MTINKKLLSYVALIIGGLLTTAGAALSQANAEEEFKNRYEALLAEPKENENEEN